MNQQMKILRSLLIFAAVLLIPPGLPGQEKPSLRDTSIMPQLEIPEITIVGKKAITLPFARKGEIYDVELFEPPAPDTSLIEERNSFAFPLGTLPRYEDSFVPLHLSAQGSIGSFTTFLGRLFADYKKRNWGIYGNAEIKSTNGHVSGAGGESAGFDVKGHALVKTDNEILGSFRTLGGVKFNHNSYGLYGIAGEDVDRSVSSVDFLAELHTVERESNSLDMGISATLWSVKDIYPASEFSSSTVTPKIGIKYGKGFSGFRLTSELLYQSTSLNYNYPIQTPSLFNFLLGTLWDLSASWKLSAGATLGHGNSAEGGSKTMLRPFASLRWQIDHDRQLMIWFKPEMKMSQYDDWMRANPYLTRQILINPEEEQINLGAHFWYNSGLYAVEIKGTALLVKNKPVQVSRNGLVDLSYIDAEGFILDMNGIVYPTGMTEIKFTGLLQPLFQKGKSDQLPMVPLLKLGARGQLRFKYPVTVWSVAELWSKQNGTLDGTVRLKERFVVSAGLSTTIIPRVCLSADISNMLDQKYEWWGGYEAPGIAFSIDAKVNIR